LIYAIFTPWEGKKFVPFSKDCVHTPSISFYVYKVNSKDIVAGESFLKYVEKNMIA
jgi:hypothetical protein